MKEQKAVNISLRLQMVASLVQKGSTVFDCGCDHGLVPIWLVQNGISKHVTAADIADGPLKAARKNICRYGLGGYIDTLRSDGLAQFQKGVADTLVIAGMGGPLMYRIISSDWDKTKSFREYIFQPQSAAEEFRKNLRLAGMDIIDERDVFEDGKYYAAMRAVFSGSTDDGQNENDDMQQRISDRYGPVLLKNRDNVLLDYILREKEMYGKILASLEEREMTGKNSCRKKEVEQFEADCSMAVKKYYGNRS